MIASDWDKCFCEQCKDYVKPVNCFGKQEYDQAGYFCAECGAPVDKAKR